MTTFLLRPTAPLLAVVLWVAAASVAAQPSPGGTDNHESHHAPTQAAPSPGQLQDEAAGASGNASGDNDDSSGASTANPRGAGRSDDDGCPMQGPMGGMGGGGMMGEGGGPGMREGDMMGQSQGMAGPMMSPPMMQRRLDLMERRMELMNEELRMMRERLQMQGRQ